MDEEVGRVFAGVNAEVEINERDGLTVGVFVLFVKERGQGAGVGFGGLGEFGCRLREDRFLWFGFVGVFRLTVFWEKFSVIIEAFRGDAFTIMEEALQWCGGRGRRRVPWHWWAARTRVRPSEGRDSEQELLFAMIRGRRRRICGER